MVLIDTSAWIEFLRRSGDWNIADEVAELLDRDLAATCGMIELELIQGLFPREAERVQSLFQALHYVDLTREDYVAAGCILRGLRQRGITVPSSDGLIAAAATRRSLPLLSIDRHFLHFLGLDLLPPR
mgnify:CR=1 FL=1